MALAPHQDAISKETRTHPREEDGDMDSKDDVDIDIEAEVDDTEDEGPEADIETIDRIYR